MKHFTHGLLSALTGLTLAGLVGCSGAGFPASLSAPVTTPTSSSSGGTVTSGTGTTLCGSGTAFQYCTTLPVAGATYTAPPPISVYASSPTSIAGWQAYVDGVDITSNVSTTPTSTSTTGQWNGVIANVTPGTHLIAVNAFDNNAPSYTPYSYSASVTIVANPFPPLPATAQVYSNLQSATGSAGTWQICNGSCSGSSGTGSSAITLDSTNFVPSLSGSTMEESSTGPGYNTLGYLKPPCPTAGCTSVSNFLDDVWFYIPSTTDQLQALEFDPDVYDGSYEYFISMQCDSVSGDWRFWDMNVNTWTTLGSGGQTITTYPCGVLTETNQWHHYQLYGTANYTAHTYSYQTFVVDGKVIFQNLGNSYPAKTYSSNPALVVEQQIDNNASATTNSVYYDNYTLTAW